MAMGVVLLIQVDLPFLDLGPGANVYARVHFVKHVLYVRSESGVSVTRGVPSSDDMVEYLPNTLLPKRAAERLDNLGGYYLIKNVRSSS